MQADRLEECWTPSAIHATFALNHLPACTTRSHHISIHLPLLNLGWSFALSLAPERIHPGKKKVNPRPIPCNWVLAAISFRQHDNKILWGNTSMHAQLSLVPDPSTNTDQISLGAISVALAHTPSAELPVETSYTLVSDQTAKVLLSVTISECPFPNGLFQARPAADSNEIEAQTDFVRQCGDRVLSRSLTTGKLFDVKFLSFSTRSPYGSTGKPFPTYASLSVLEKHVSLPDSKLGDRWTTTLAIRDHADPSHETEIQCPTEYEYELDSDFEDEDCTVEPGAILKGKQPEMGATRSISSLSSFELGGASDQDLVDDQLEEIIQDEGEPSHLSPVAEMDCERTILVKFATHKTWRAFLWYCYTGRVEFNGLRSQISPNVRRHRAAHEDGPPSCSPKSMYRLADLVGNKDLKEMALQAIKERMSEANVMDETFSIFTSKYPDVRELQVSVLMEHCRSPEVKRAFLKTMMKYSHMPHAEPVLAAFYDQLVG